MSHWPDRPQDWELTISLSCSVFDHDVPLYSSRLDQAPSVFSWTPTREMLENLRCSEELGDCDAVPIRIVLFHTKGPDDLLAYHSGCKCVPHSPWLFCGSPPGVVNLTEAVNKARDEAGNPTAAHPLDRLSVREGRLAWAGLALGSSRTDVESFLDQELPVEPEEVPACGEWHSRVAIGDREVSLQWSSSDPAAELESVSVPLTTMELGSGVSLALRANKKVPRLEPPDGWTESSHYLALSPANSDVLLIKPSPPDQVFFVSLEACLD